MEVEQLVPELGRGQDVTLDAATGSDEDRLQPRLQLHERPRNRQSWVEMPTGATTGDEDPQPLTRPEPRADS